MSNASQNRGKGGGGTNWHEIRREAGVQVSRMPADLEFGRLDTPQLKLLVSTVTPEHWRKLPLAVPPVIQYGTLSILHVYVMAVRCAPTNTLRCTILSCAQNGVGIVAAGGLGGLLYLQKGEQGRLEAEQEAQRAQQRAEVDGLSSQVPPYFPLKWLMYFTL